MPRIVRMLEALRVMTWYRRKVSFMPKLERDVQLAAFIAHIVVDKVELVYSKE